jgi:hypothetical protein
MGYKSREIKKVVFYTGLARIFREALICNLYEISQVYPVILLAEELDEKLKNILENKKLFPLLEKIIFVNQHTGPKININILEKNRNLRNLAKKIISIYKPDVLITPGYVYYFEIYLMRFAKKINALSIGIQSSHTVDCAQTRESADLTNAYLRFPNFLPLFVRTFLIKCRKYVGHFLYYWISPLLTGGRPFLGKASYILKTGVSGPREGEFQIVFSGKDYDFHIKNGVSADKLYILDHPLKGGTRNFFMKNVLAMNNYKSRDKTATLLIPAEGIGFRRKDSSLISEEEKLETRIEIIKAVARKLKGWKIFVKPHPNFKNFIKIKNIFESISDSIKVVNPKESSNGYVKISDVVIGLPVAHSNALSQTILLFPEKLIFGLDLDKELLGDFYKDFDGIEYIDDMDKFIETLSLIADNKYQKKYNPHKDLKKIDFHNTIEMLNYLYNI